MIRQSENEKGDGNQNDGYFHHENVFDHRIEAKDAGNFVSHDWKKCVMSNDGLPPFVVGLDLLLFRLGDWHYWMSLSLDAD